MELVYLWVEDYKNIKKQGFNFSPRFDCKYDEDTKELTIDKNEDYVSIFPDNINITAIVGENGSGKSTISEVLATFSFQEYHSSYKKDFLVFFNGKKFVFKQGFTGEPVSFNIKNNTAFEYSKQNKSRTIDIIYFSNDVASIFNNPNFAYRLQYYHHIDAYYQENKNLMTNNKYNTNREKLNKLEIFNKRLQNILLKDEKILTHISDRFIFDSYKRELHLYEIGAYIVSNKDFMDLLGVEKITGNTVFKDNIDLGERFLKLLILFRLSNHFFDNESNEIVKSIKDEFNQKDFNIENCMNIFDKISKIDKKENIYTQDNIKNILETFDYLKNEIWIEKDKKIISDDFKSSNELLNLLFQEINRTNFFNSQDLNYNYFTLSSGEREYVSIFVALIHHLLRISENSSGTNNEFILLFDEAELGLHPNWQKRLIKDIVYFIKKYINKKFQIIFNSHSPFILSDLPKENTILLERDKNGNCNNVTKEISVDTFGANIHTLLSHGFFMKDGLMGEFAKGKIEEIKNFYEKVKKSKNPKKTYLKKYKANITNFRYIQSIIGEPFLNTIMKNYLDELDQIFDSENYKKNQIESLIKQFGEDELQKYLESKK